MSLLFDQNISFRLAKNLKDIFPDAVHIRILGLENISDVEIWNFAKINNHCIVTFDSDFNDFSNLYGFPPKVIWIRTHDQSTSNVERLLRQKFDEISVFLNNNSEFGCLEIVG